MTKKKKKEQRQIVKFDELQQTLQDLLKNLTWEEKVLCCARMNKILRMEKCANMRQEHHTQMTSMKPSSLQRRHLRS